MSRLEERYPERGMFGLAGALDDELDDTNALADDEAVDDLENEDVDDLDEDDLDDEDDEDLDDEDDELDEDLDDEAVDEDEA